MCIKSEVEEILFKLAINDHSDEAFLLTKHFGPNGLSAPAQGLCLDFSSITTDFNISSGERFRTNGPLVIFCCLASKGSPFQKLFKSNRVSQLHCLGLLTTG